MQEYIVSKMASVGAGTGDTIEAQAICDTMSTDERDVLDCWHNLGIAQTMSDSYKATERKLREAYSEDDLQVLAAYVSARRNTSEY